MALSYYSRDDIAQAMVKASEGREVAVRYGDKGFGKRPDMLKYPAEIKEFAKQGVTSFHVSEERWKDPLAISAQLKQQELADLRAGWDLVIDIDSKDWQISRIASHLVVQALQAHGITCLSAKFSGNKGFHIAVPFESFPPTVLGVETRLQFPAFPRRVAQYLVDYIKDKYITIGTDKITFANSYSLSIEDLTRITEKPIYLECQSCLKEVGKKTEQTKTDFACPRCEHIATTTEEIDYLSCEKCGAIMEKMPRKGKQTLLPVMRLN